MTPWPDADTPAGQPAHDPPGGPEFAQLLAAERLLQARLAGAAPPPDVVKDVTARLAELAELLSGYQVSELERVDGRRPDLPARGNALLPAYVIEDEDETSTRARVTFTRFYLGGNGAAHGGALPLLFDDLLGRVVNRQLPGVARTAFLTVNYRQITPIDVELCVDASLERVAGRKRWGRAHLYDPDRHLLADAEGLFVELRPGQP